MEPSSPADAPHYPGYDVLAKAPEWDAHTREVIRQRVHEVPQRRFFSEHEWSTLERLFDLILPQDDRPPNRRIPIVPWLDHRLHQRQGRGYRYEDMPADPDAWRALVRALDDEATRAWRTPFAQLHPQRRELLLSAVAQGEGESPHWRRIPRAFSMVVEEAVRHYYAHPSAWNEIGFAGPRFPRIYARVDRDNPDEPQERTTHA